MAKERLRKSTRSQMFVSQSYEAWLLQILTRTVRPSVFRYKCVVNISLVKYVALLAFSRIVVSYPHLVLTHQDVIMDCLEDADISIRLQALELAARMVTKETLEFVVGRLIGQLEEPHYTPASGDGLDREDVTELGDHVGRNEQRKCKPHLPVPDDYRVEVLHRILDICSHDNYSKLADFEWYVSVLIQLVKHLPTNAEGRTAYQRLENHYSDDAASRIGLEVRNIAVRVRNVRMEATRAAESLLLIDNRQSVSVSAFNAIHGVLGPLAWVVGEYAEYLSSPGKTLQSLIDISTISLSGGALPLFVQAVPKVLARIIRDYGDSWSVAQKSEVSLFLARIVEFLELLADHPDLDVQERAIEFLEIMRLAADVMQTGGIQQAHVPYLLSSVIPSLFYGLELNPVAPNAQKKVPLPDQLCLTVPFNSSVRRLFDDNQAGTYTQPNDFYHDRKTQTPSDLQNEIGTNIAHQGSEVRPELAAMNLRQKVEWKQRNRDDPFYIGADQQNNAATPLEPASSTLDSDGLDIDSIPIVDLKISKLESAPTFMGATPYDSPHNLPAQPKKYEVIPDEVIGAEETGASSSHDEPVKSKRGLLQVDSSGLKHFTLGGDAGSDIGGLPGKNEDDVEMATAMKEIEKARLEMQRASERVYLEGTPSEGTLVKKRRKQKKSSHGRVRRADLSERDGQPSSTQEKARQRDNTPRK